MKPRFVTVTGAIAAGAAFAGTAYWKDMLTARQRVESGRQVLDTPNGPIEFGEAGDGPAVFVVHGAGGGFDQGLELGRAFLGDGYRLIAPSRFGYLGTPLPEDASVEAQAEAHLRLLDALNLERVPVIGVSAGAPSALQLALRHPERCSALVLVVPLAYAPDRVQPNAPSPFFGAIVNVLTASDFLFWTATKVAHDTMVKTILGTPIEVYKSATPEQKKLADAVLRNILPVSRRAAGLRNESAIANSLKRPPLEELRVPTLIIAAADCLYGTYDSSLYTADNVRGAKLVVFPVGGHLLIGHDDEVRLQIASFLAETAPVSAAPLLDVEMELVAR